MSEFAAGFPWQRGGHNPSVSFACLVVTRLLHAVLAVLVSAHGRGGVMPRTGLMGTCLGPVIFGVRAGGQIRGATISPPLSGGSVSWRRVSYGRVARLVCVVAPLMLIGRSGGGQEGAAQMVLPSDSSSDPSGVPSISKRSWVKSNWYTNSSS